MDKSTASPSLAHMAMLYGPRTKQELDAALDPFSMLRNEYRRRFKEDGIALTQDEAVEAYKLVAPLYPPDMTDEEAALQAVLNAISFPCFETGGFGFRGPAVKAIIEGFEREIAEGSDAALYIRHHGEAEARKEDSWSRFIDYEALEYFVGLMDAEQRARDADPRAPRIRVVDGDRDSLLDRAQAILAKLTVTRPRGRYDPRLTLRRDNYIVIMLHDLSGCGLEVTSLEGESLAGALAEVIDVPESTIAKVWENSPLRSSQLNDALPAELRIPESLIRRRRRDSAKKPPPVQFPPDVQCAKCGKAGKVPLQRLATFGNRARCVDCYPLSA